MTTMQPALIFTEPARVHGMPHAIMHPAESAHATSSGSMTPRSHVHAELVKPQETTSSHASNSPTFQPSSSDVSQNNRRRTNNPDFSPISSQEHGSSASLASPIQEEEARGPKPFDMHHPTHSGAKSESPRKEEFPRDFASGQKRTASGQMKRSSITNIEDLKKEQATTRHSRTSSLLSNSSTGSVMELSQQLRTRLSYAMYKVKTGNPSQSLDELESLASHSPRSSTSAFQSNRHAAESPRTAMAGDWRRKWSSSEGSDVGVPAQPSSTAWSRSNGGPHPPSNPASRRALAPPANIVPGSRRRPAPNGVPNCPYVGGPYTPSRNLHVSTSSPKRTPSQNAAMEADAVETLLFMASPGNSGYHPNASGAPESSLRSTAPMSSSQPSPLRTQFHYNEKLSSPRRRVGFVDTIPNQKTRDLSIEVRDIDRMLDESSDDSSDGLDEAISLANSRARMTAQR